MQGPEHQPPEDRPDLGLWLELAVQDIPPAPTQPDPEPLPGSPVDTALAAFVAACNAYDAENDAKSKQGWEERQAKYRDAINEAAGEP
jgi:hypothetical protein